ncbi:MAG: hypothetical protein ABSD68_00245 [Candidatus Micrarchaeales archaeon]|jgi:hypothetical protein
MATRQREEQKQEIGKVRIDRNVKLLTYPFTQVFKGFGRVKAIKRIFGKDTVKVLSRLRIALYSSKWGGYMWIDEKNKCLVCNIDYLKTAEKRYLYLDIIHELVHIKQMLEGKELFDENYAYINRPTEREAYDAAVDEAKRLGMSRKEIIDYLEVEWISKKEFRNFLKRFDLS